MRLPYLQNVYVTTLNLSLICEFYERVLGVPIKFKDKDRWAQYDASMTNFSLSSVDEAPEAVAKFLLVFEVDDLAAYRLKIESAGGEITARRDMRRHGILLASKDIGGNSLQLFQKATAPAQR